MNIILLEDWGGAEIGASLVIDEVTGKDLIGRGIAKETEEEKPKLSARKGAAKSGGKDDEL
jgi:hypothetical protein